MNECPLTNEELFKVLDEDHETVSAILNGTHEDVELLRNVCRAVLVAKRNHNIRAEQKALRNVCMEFLEGRGDNNIRAEQKALLERQRWGRRGRGVDALTYIAANVNDALGRKAFRLPYNRAFRRAFRMNPNKPGFAKPIDLSKIIR